MKFSTFWRVWLLAFCWCGRFSAEAQTVYCFTNVIARLGGASETHCTEAEWCYIADLGPTASPAWTPYAPDCVTRYYTPGEMSAQMALRGSSWPPATFPCGGSYGCEIRECQYVVEGATLYEFHVACGVCSNEETIEGWWGSQTLPDMCYDAGLGHNVSGERIEGWYSAREVQRLRDTYGDIRYGFGGAPVQYTYSPIPTIDLGIDHAGYEFSPHESFIGVYLVWCGECNSPGCEGTWTLSERVPLTVRTLVGEPCVSEPGGTNTSYFGQTYTSNAVHDAMGQWAGMFTNVNGDLTSPMAAGNALMSNSLLSTLSFESPGTVWALPATYFGKSESWKPIDELSWVPSWLPQWLSSLALFACWYTVLSWVYAETRNEANLWMQTVQISLPTAGVPVVGAAVGASTVGLAMLAALSVFIASVAAVIGVAMAGLVANTFPAWPSAIVGIVEVLNYLCGFTNCVGVMIAGAGSAAGVRLAGMVARLIRSHLPTTGAIALGLWLGSGQAEAGRLRVLVTTTNPAVNGSSVYWPVMRSFWLATNGTVLTRTVPFTAPGSYEFENWDTIYLLAGQNWTHTSTLAGPVLTNQSWLDFEAVWTPASATPWQSSTRRNAASWAFIGFGSGVAIAASVFGVRLFVRMMTQSLQ